MMAIVLTVTLFLGGQEHVTRHVGHQRFTSERKCTSEAASLAKRLAKASKRRSTQVVVECELQNDVFI